MADPRIVVAASIYVNGDQYLGEVILPFRTFKIQLKIFEVPGCWDRCRGGPVLRI